MPFFPSTPSGVSNPAIRRELSRTKRPGAGKRKPKPTARRPYRGMDRGGR